MPGRSPRWSTKFLPLRFLVWFGSWFCGQKESFHWWEQSPLRVTRNLIVRLHWPTSPRPRLDLCIKCLNKEQIPLTSKAQNIDYQHEKKHARLSFKKNWAPKRHRKLRLMPTWICLRTLEQIQNNPNRSTFINYGPRLKNEQKAKPSTKINKNHQEWSPKSTQKGQGTWILCQRRNSNIPARSEL